MIILSFSFYNLFKIKILFYTFFSYFKEQRASRMNIKVGSSFNGSIFVKLGTIIRFQSAKC